MIRSELLDDSGIGITAGSSGSNMPAARLLQYTCATCLQLCSSKDLLIRHVYSHVPCVFAPLHVCQVCGQIFLKLSLFCAHKIFHDKKIACKEASLTELSCAVCLQMFLCWSSLTKHVFSHISAISTPCRIEVFEDIARLHSYNYIGRTLQRRSKVELSRKKSVVCYGRNDDSVVTKPLHGWMIRSDSGINVTAESSGSSKSVASALQYTCASCLQPCSSVDLLIRHVFSHKLCIIAPLHICQVCGQIFLKLAILCAHKIYHNKKINCVEASLTELSCAACLQMFLCWNTLTKHVFSHILAITSPLRVYPRHFEVFEDVVSHHSYNYSGRSLLRRGYGECESNIQSFSKQLASAKLNTSIPEKPVNTFGCSNRPKYEQSCKRNLSNNETFHQRNSLYSDDFIGKSLIHQNFNLHQKIDVAEHPVVCKLNGECVTSLVSVKRCGSRYSSKGQFFCKVCGKSFTQSSGLKVHQRIHLGERPFCCNVCKKSFTRSETLKIHQRIHQGERPFSCEDCGKSFTQAFRLKTHKMIHLGKRLLSCELCKRSFLLSEQLKLHMRIHSNSHSDSNQFSCQVCGKTFTQPSNLTTHQRIHLGERPFTCNQCGKSFITSPHLNRHKMLHTGERPFVCELCGKSFVKSYRLKRHYRIHSDERPFSCEICGKSFRELHYLTNHQMIHSGERPFSCYVCGKTFGNINYFRQHQKIHSSKRSFICKVCGKSYAESRNLKKHQTVHTGEYLFLCEVCGKLCRSSQSLKYHRSIHSRMLPFSCNTCGKTFQQTESLRKHENMHLERNPFVCEVCGKGFTLSCNLKTHKKIHLDERLFSCEFCGKSFIQSGHLKTHLKIHSNDRSFICKICGKSFIQPGNLKTHLKIHSDQHPLAF